MRTVQLLVGQEPFRIPQWWTRFTAAGWLFEQRADGSIWYRDPAVSEMAPKAWTMAHPPVTKAGAA